MDLPGALYLDLQKDITSRLPVLLDKGAGGAVIIVHKTGMLEKTVFFYKILKHLV